MIKCHVRCLCTADSQHNWKVILQYTACSWSQNCTFCRLCRRIRGEKPFSRVYALPESGGAGMVMAIEPIARCIRALQSERSYDEVIYVTPDGERFEQRTANRLSLARNLIILCGHYKGVDERVRELFITKEISVGDYVLSGGELPAAVISDAIIRLLPGVLNDETSALTDSFQDDLLAPPVYTRPAEFEGHTVPDVLLSGHEAKINEWRFEKALERTKQRRPDLLS
ncbi:MAG: tRNA (guanosine(37)-N1)-methyltransferase TrmD [Cytophagaceae bacterium]|nr:MAG: tRNA (guanosine(37)-N1)-methyltransferase TrmD [Cytophagaceae bacterium]